MDWVDKPQNYKDLYGILQLLRGSHLNNFPLETLKLGWVVFHSVTFQLKCLAFQSNQYEKPVPAPFRFCNWLYAIRARRKLQAGLTAGNSIEDYGSRSFCSSAERILTFFAFEDLL